MWLNFFYFCFLRQPSSALLSILHERLCVPSGTASLCGQDLCCLPLPIFERFLHGLFSLSFFFIIICLFPLLLTVVFPPILELCRPPPQRLVPGFSYLSLMAT